MSTTPTAYEMLQRERKVRTLYRYLMNELAHVLERPENQSMWEDAARAAGVNMPSEVSKAQLLKMLRDQR